LEVYNATGAWNGESIVFVDWMIWWRMEKRDGVF